MQDVSNSINLISHDIIRGSLHKSGIDGDVVRVFANERLILELNVTDFNQDYHTVVDHGGHIAFEAKVNLPLGPETFDIRITDGSGKLLPGGSTVLRPLTTRKVSDYIGELRAWLDERFSPAEFIDGRYYGHQPIYGFRQGHSEPNWHDRYIISYAIMRKLAHLRFNSFFDAGGAEGYKAALVKHLFGSDVISCDLSQEACNRAADLYGIKTAPIDLHGLAFPDESYDVVLASETVEHVFDNFRAVDELLRIARKAVVITVPHETPEQVADTVKREELHGHIHYFDLKSFNYLKARGYSVHVEPILSLKRLRRITAVLMEADVARVQHYKSPLARTLVKLSSYVFKTIFNRSVASAFMEGDHVAAQSGRYAGMVVVIVKDPSAWSDTPLRPVSMSDVTAFAVAPLGKDGVGRHGAPVPRPA